MALEHLGGDRWRVRVYVGTDPATKKRHQRSRSFTAHGIQAATKRAKKIDAELTDEKVERRNRNETVAGLADEWLTNAPKRAQWSPTTLARYTQIVDRIKTDLGGRRVELLTAYDVDRWLSSLRTTAQKARHRAKTTPTKGLSDRTIIQYHAVLRAMFRQGKRWKFVSNLDAVADATPPSLPKDEVQSPTSEVMQLLLNPKSPMLRVAVLIAASTGVRRGEIVGLRWSDIGGDMLTVRRVVLDDKVRTIKKPKSGRARVLPIGAELVDALAECRAAQIATLERAAIPVPDDWFVFYAEPHPSIPRRPGWLSHAWDEHRRSYGADTVNLHHVRHWHASTLIDGGVSITAVSKRLGHSKVSTTVDIYGHPSTEEERRAPGVIASALALPPSS